MKPFSACTTPRKLMAPISRHFLPVLQPEPPAWLTTGLIKGSRLPFELYLLSGTTDCSLVSLAVSEAPLAATALAWSFGSATGAARFGRAKRLAPMGSRFAKPGLFAPAGSVGCDED